MSIRIPIVRACVIFLSIVTIVTLAVFLFHLHKKRAVSSEREYLVAQLVRIADPVLVAISRDELKKLMPVDTPSGHVFSRKKNKPS